MRVANLRKNLLIVLAVSSISDSQVLADASIPEPTSFGAAATESPTNITAIGSSRIVESDESRAEVDAIQIVRPDNVVMRGVRIALSSGDQHQALYLDVSQTVQFRNELIGFKEYYEGGIPCGAQSLCVHGVARCRPSQSVQQAFCPSFFTSPDGQQGLTVSTPENSFRFPHVEPSILISALETAIEEIDGAEESKI